MIKRYDINLFYRFIGLMIMLLSICFINNFWLLTILFFILLYFNKKSSMCYLVLYPFTFLLLTYKYFNGGFLFVNYILILDYIISFIININKEEYSFIKDMIKNKKFTYSSLKDEISDDIINENNDNLEEFIKDEELDSTKVDEIKEELDSKNKSDIYNKMSTYYLRLFKNKNDLFKNYGLNIITIIYLGILSLFLILVVVL